MPPSAPVHRHEVKHHRRRPARQQGFALVAALALLVVLGSTGAVMLRLSSMQQAGASLAVLGLRAEWAARGGIEWAIHEANRLGSCPAPTTTLLLAEGALSGFSVTVRCNATEHVEGSDVRSSLIVRAEASFGSVGSSSYVFRELSASVVL